MIKELVLHTKGVRSDMGSRLAHGYVPNADTELMARFRRAGLVLIGTTQTSDSVPTRRPKPRRSGQCIIQWDLGSSADGSCGGSGAAVAAGILPIGHGNDGGGWIRIPQGPDYAKSCPILELDSAQLP